MILRILFFFLWSLSAAAQATQVELFLPTAYDDSVRFGVSVVDAQNDQTVYAVQCTEGQFASTITCGPTAPTFIITEGPSRYIATTYSTVVYTSVTDDYQTQVETCSLHGTTEAACTATITNSGTAGAKTTTVSTTLTGPSVAEYYIYKANVTGGIENLGKSESLASAGVKTTGTATFAVFVGVFVFVAIVIL